MVLEPDPPHNVLTVDIDPDVMITPDPGKEVALHVAYSSFGAWLLESTCDTLQSGIPCDWDLVVSVPEPGELSTTDSRAIRIDPSSLRIVIPGQTSSDAIELIAPPGERLELDVMLDGVHDGWADYSLDAWMVNWIEGGIVQLGAPSNPVRFAPTPLAVP